MCIYIYIHITHTHIHMCIYICIHTYVYNVNTYAERTREPRTCPLSTDRIVAHGRNTAQSIQHTVCNVRYIIMIVIFRTTTTTTTTNNNNNKNNQNTTNNTTSYDNTTNHTNTHNNTHNNAHPARAACPNSFIIFISFSMYNIKTHSSNHNDDNITTNIHNDYLLLSSSSVSLSLVLLLLSLVLVCGLSKLLHHLHHVPGTFIIVNNNKNITPNCLIHLLYVYIIVYKYTSYTFILLYDEYNILLFCEACPNSFIIFIMFPARICVYVYIHTCQCM